MGVPKAERLSDAVTLYQGRCEDVLASLSGVDAVVTDPPYGIRLRNGDVDGHRRKGSYKIAGDDSTDAALQVIEWAASRELTIVAFASPWKPWPGKWRNLIVWDKGGAVGGGGDIATCLKRSWELIQVARNGRLRESRGESVWRFPIVPADTAEHIAAKPVELMRKLIRQFTDEGDTVLDPFAGSGTTLVAAQLEGRRAIGCEIDPRYCEITRRRVREADGRAPNTLFAGTVPTPDLFANVGDSP